MDGKSRENKFVVTTNLEIVVKIHMKFTNKIGEIDDFTKPERIFLRFH